jgi:hypothetical protein
VLSVYLGVYSDLMAGVLRESESERLAKARNVEMMVEKIVHHEREVREGVVEIERGEVKLLEKYQPKVDEIKEMLKQMKEKNEEIDEEIYDRK